MIDYRFIGCLFLIEIEGVFKNIYLKKTKNWYNRYQKKLIREKSR